MKKYLLATFTFWGSMAGSAQCQPIDTLIDVGGYRLHFHIIKGNGMPILFEGGAGADVSTWDIILKPLADINTINKRWGKESVCIDRSTAK